MTPMSSQQSRPSPAVLVGVPHRPKPSFVPDTVRGRDIDALWDRAVGPMAGDGSGDPEDWAENAARVHAAVTAFGIDRTWLTVFEPGNVRTVRADGAHSPTPETAVVYGQWPSTHPFGFLDATDPANHYHHLAAFHRAAGRETITCTIGDPDDEDLDRAAAWPTDVQAIEALHEAGVERALLKRVGAKLPLIEVDVTAARADIGSVRYDPRILTHDLGRPGAFLLQERIPMRYEYRAFVSGHRPVTGAGCVEEYTPTQITGAEFDTRVREDRWAHSPIERRGREVAEMVEFAFAVAADLKDERPEMADYVIDLAIAADGRPVVIELNGLLNAGLYATDPVLVTRALAARSGAARPLGTGPHTWGA